MIDKPVLVFDVNETILDLRCLESVFVRLFDEEGAMRRWFAELIIASLAVSLADSYVPFGELGAATLRKLGKIKGVSIVDRDIDEVRAGVEAMPPYPEVPGALKTLREAGFRMVTLNNNPFETTKRQLESAGIAAFFETFFSVDGTVNRYKPAPETYALVERELGLAPDRL